MEKKLSFAIEEDIYEKFCLAASLTKEEEAKALENCLRWYITTTFEKLSQEYRPNKKKKQENKGSDKFYAKALKKIPVWAIRPDQYCHKILRGFFLCEKQYGLVLLDELENICSNEESPELYVPAFRNNYYQMKLDGAKTYGKVFEDNGTTVRIWNEVEGILGEYKEYFCS